MSEEAERLREQMVRDQIQSRGVKDRHVLEAMRRVPRHEFCSDHSVEAAHGDHPLPVGHGQTISQPYIVAVMTETVAVRPGDKVLEIGTGSGYQAAVLAEIGCEVYTIEIVPELAESARRTLERLGYENVHCRVGNAAYGWPEQAPFDGALGTCAAPDPPEAVVEQLQTGSSLVLPVDQGAFSQWLTVITKTEKGKEQRRMMPVRFVPMRDD